MNVRKMEKQTQSNQDTMLNTPVSKLIITLGIPSIITMLITNFYNMADTYFVGQISTSASGAVGIVFGIMAILQAIGFLFGHGAGSIISRLLGGGDGKRADRISSISLFCAFTGGLIVSAAGFVFMKPMMYFMGSTETIYPYAVQYASCIFVAAPFIVSSFSMNNILRYQGYSSLGLIGIGVGAVLNIVLDPILMFGFDMGILGAGMATAISQIVGFFVLLFIFQSKRTKCTFRFFHIKYFRAEIALIAYTGLPSLIRQAVGSISTMLLNREAAIYGGDAAVAAMSIVSRITMFVFAVGLGVGQGFQPVAGFNYGARRFDRVRKGYIFTLISGASLLGALALTAIFLSDRLVGIFRDDAAVIAIGSTALLYQCISVFFMPVSVCTNMLLQSTGKNGQASLTALLRNGFCFIPLILILPKIYGIWGIQLSQPLADVISSLVSIPFALNFFKKLPREITDL